MRVFAALLILLTILGGCSPAEQQKKREAWRLYSESAAIVAALNGLFAAHPPEYDRQAMAEDNLAGIRGPERRMYLDRAEARLKEAVELDPDRVEAWYVLGFVYRMQGRADDARQAFEISLDYEPSRELTYRHLFDAYTSTNRFDEAREIIERYAHAFPGDTIGRLSYRAVLELHEHRLDDALSTANQLIRLDPRQAEAYLVRGSALLLMERFADADTAFAKAVDLDPGIVGRVERLTALGPKQPIIPDNATDNVSGTLADDITDALSAPGAR